MPRALHRPASLCNLLALSLAVLLVCYLYFLYQSSTLFSQSHSLLYKPSHSEIDSAYQLSLLALPLTTQLDNAYVSSSLVKHRLACYPFLFPRYTSALYITGWPNHGAGLGHQFGEWLFAPALAHSMGLTYVYSGFLGNAGRWTRWLGFGAGEDTETDLYNTFSTVRLVELHESVFFAKGNTQTVEQWVSDRIIEHDRWAQSTWPVNVIHQHNQIVLPSSNDSVIVYDDSNDVRRMQATLLRLYRIHVPHPPQRYACQPDLNLLLRQKYCAARVASPVTENLYPEDRRDGKIIVAFHMRCGDSCYDSFRITPFPSVILTIRTIYELLSTSGFGEPVFHLFSQAPLNNTAELHFAPLFDEFRGTPIKLVGHFATHAHITMHHFVLSDLLILSQSGFSLVASVLHQSVAMGPITTSPCRYEVTDYNKEVGTFSNQSLIDNFNASVGVMRPRFESLSDCRRLRPWNENLGANEKVKYVFE